MLRPLKIMKLSGILTFGFQYVSKLTFLTGQRRFKILGQ